MFNSAIKSSLFFMVIGVLFRKIYSVLPYYLNFQLFIYILTPLEQDFSRRVRRWIFSIRADELSPKLDL